jgi:hypothetical protein
VKQQMQEYRAYIIGSKGLILRRIDLLCENDEAAKKRTRQFVNGHDVELWQGTSKVAVFETKTRPKKVAARSLTKETGQMTAKLPK